MSQYLSLSAFAYQLGCPESTIRALVAENRIGAYQVGHGEPFIRKTELPVARDIISHGRLLTKDEQNIAQDEKDQVSRTESRVKIAAERKEQELKLEERKSKLLAKRLTP